MLTSTKGLNRTGKKQFGVNEFIISVLWVHNIENTDMNLRLAALLKGKGLVDPVNGDGETTAPPNNPHRSGLKVTENIIDNGAVMQAVFISAMDGQ